MAAAGPDLYERLQIRYPPSPPARGKPCPAGKLQAGAGSGVEPLPSPAVGWLGVTPASLPQRRHLRPLQQRPAARWAPHWLWPRGCCWCWGPPWSPSSSCMCRGRQSCGQRRQSWRQLGPRCCWILMVSGDAGAAHSTSAPACSPCRQPLPIALPASPACSPTCNPCPQPCLQPLPALRSRSPCPQPLPTAAACNPCLQPLPAVPARSPCPRALAPSPCPVPACNPCPQPLPAVCSRSPCPQSLPTNIARNPCLQSLPTTPARSPCPQPLPAVTGRPLPAPLADPVAGSQSPAKSPAAAQRQKEQLGRWLQGLALGWRYHDGQIYYFSGEHKAWGDAEAACRSSHSHLASITSPEEQDYLAREARGRPYWIGLTATGPGGSWRWVDGAAYSQAQSFWAPGQPDSTDHGKWGLEGCAQIHPVGNGLWNDHNCNFSFAWICKRDLSRP